MSNKNEAYITIPELAKILGLSRVAVFKKVKKGEIRAIKIGRNYAIPKAIIEEITLSKLSASNKKIIDLAVKKTVAEYGHTLKLLGKD